MSKLMIDGFLFCAIACAACNGDSNGPAAVASDPFVGRWACSDQLSITFTSPADAPMQNKMQSSTLVISGTGGMLSASTETDSGAGCTVSFTSKDSTGTLSSGQTCTTAEGLTLTYTSGTASVNGSALNSTFNFDAAGTLPINGTMVAATATGSQTSTCSRLSSPGTGTGGQTTTGGW